MATEQGWVPCHAHPLSICIPKPGLPPEVVRLWALGEMQEDLPQEGCGVVGDQSQKEIRL